LKLAPPTATGLHTALMSDVQLQMNEFARALRRARTQQQLSVEHASKQCLLSDNQILGLEAADLRPFYSPVYALRGAERYARFLGVGPVPQACIAKFSADSRYDVGGVSHANVEDSRPNRWASRLKHWMDPLKAPRRPPAAEPER